jgi:hypothetical protein
VTARYLRWAQIITDRLHQQPIVSCHRRLNRNVPYFQHHGRTPSHSVWIEIPQSVGMHPHRILRRPIFRDASNGLGYPGPWGCAPIYLGTLGYPTGVPQSIGDASPARHTYDHYGCVQM